MKANKNLLSVANEFKLELKSADYKRPKESPWALGVWDGQDFRFVQSQSSYWWFDLTKLLWKYGLSPLRTRKLVRDTVGTFLRMYEAPTFPFISLSKAINDLGLVLPTSTTGESFLAQSGILPPFSTDIVQASTRVNYAQNLPQLHGLETAVCMATDNAMAVEGGNWQIFDRMIDYSRANLLLNESVVEVLRQDNGTFIVKSHGRMSVGRYAGRLRSHLKSGLYDTVILSTPFHFSNIVWSPVPTILPKKIDYVRLHVTLFTSPHTLSPGYFALPSRSPVPEIILTTLPDDGSSPPPFFSISVLRKVFNPTVSREEYAFKIFSSAPLEPQLLSKLLGFNTTADTVQDISDKDIGWTYAKIWDSYPYLTPTASFDGPQLDEGLYYTSGIESFISTMETSSLMGMNVAELVLGARSQKSDEQGASWEL